MVAIIFLISMLLLGYSLMRWLNLPLYAFEKPALVVLLGLFGWVWISFLLSLVLPYWLSLSGTIIASGAVSFIALKRRPAAAHQLELPRGIRDWRLWAGFSAITTAGLGYLFWTHDLISRSDGIYSAGSAWADYGLHASLISHFAVMQRLPLDFPLAAGTHLTYPFLADLLSAWFVIGGWSLHTAIFVPNLLLTVAFIQLFLGFGTRLMGRLGAAIGGLALTLLSGSTAGVWVAWQDWQASHQSLWYFLGHMMKDYTTLAVPNIQVANFVSDIIMPQHAFLLGLPVFATVMILFYEARKHQTTRWIIAAGVLIGLLPLAHPHTFVVLGLVLITFTLDDIRRHYSWRSPWIISLGLAGLLALPQYLWQSLANGTGTGGHWAVGWVISPGELVLSFWWNNFGPTGFWIILLPIVLYLRKSWRRYLIWYLPFAIVFVFANLYALQPFAYDNLKLILYAYLMGLLFAAGFGIEIIKRQRWLIILAIPIIVLCIGSGTLAIVQDGGRHDQFASLADESLASWIEHNTNPTTVFAETDIPNDPIVTLAGRPIVVGYDGWLYNFNLDYQPRIQAVLQALQGDAEPLRAYHASYLAVSAYPNPGWPVNLPALNTDFPIAYQNASWTIYRLPHS